MFAAGLQRRKQVQEEQGWGCACPPPGPAASKGWLLITLVKVGASLRLCPLLPPGDESFPCSFPRPPAPFPLPWLYPWPRLSAPAPLPWPSGLLTLPTPSPLSREACPGGVEVTLLQGVGTQFLLNMGAAELAPRSSIYTDGETRALAAPGPGKDRCFPQSAVRAGGGLAQHSGASGRLFPLSWGARQLGLGRSWRLSDKAQRPLQPRLQLPLLLISAPTRGRCQPQHLGAAHQPCPAQEALPGPAATVCPCPAQPCPGGH